MQLSIDLVEMYKFDGHLYGTKEAAINAAEERIFSFVRRMCSGGQYGSREFSSITQYLLDHGLEIAPILQAISDAKAVTT